MVANSRDDERIMEAMDDIERSTSPKEFNTYTEDTEDLKMRSHRRVNPFDLPKQTIKLDELYKEIKNY